jgi:hypothetical protein
MPHAAQRQHEVCNILSPAVREVLLVTRPKWPFVAFTHRIVLTELAAIDCRNKLYGNNWHVVQSLERRRAQVTERMGKILEQDHHSDRPQNI